MNTARLPLVLVLALTPFMAPAASSTELAELQSLRAQLQALEQQVRDLSRRIETNEQAAAATPDRTSPASAAEAPSFTIKASSETHRLRIRANSQVDARFVVHGDQGFNDSFLIRRLPVSIEAQLGEKFFCRLMPDFAPSNVVLLESYVRYQQSPAFNLLLGKTKSPFDVERLVAQTDLLFLERAHPTSLAPNRDIGVQVFGDLAGGTLTYQLAWLNGARDNDSTINDLDDGKELVARLMAHPFRNGGSSLLRGLGFGLAVSRGEKTAGTPNGLRTSVPQTFFSWRPSIANDGRHTRIEPQAYLYAGPVGIIGSWVASRQALSAGPDAAPRHLTNSAWYAAASVVVTGEDASYRGVTPMTTFSPANGTWGALEIAARHSALHVDDGAFPFFATPASAGRARTSTLGFNWYLSSNVKASLNFEHTHFAGGAAGVSREDEDALLSRVQVRY